jgi:hypothetical protein
MHIGGKTAPQALIHIHLSCKSAILMKRYSMRSPVGIREGEFYEETLQNMTEKAVPALSNLADFAIATDDITEQDVLTCAMVHIDARLRYDNNNPVRGPKSQKRKESHVLKT